MFAKRIKELRLQKELTQEALGNIVGAKPQTVSNREAGNNYPNSETLMKLTEIFNVSSDYLLGINNTEKIKQANLSRIFSDRMSAKAIALYDKMLASGMSEEQIENYINITIAVTKKSTP